MLTHTCIVMFLRCDFITQVMYHSVKMWLNFSSVQKAGLNLIWSSVTLSHYHGVMSHWYIPSCWLNIFYMLRLEIRTMQKVWSSVIIIMLPNSCMSKTLSHKCVERHPLRLVELAYKVIVIMNEVFYDVI